MRIKLKLNPVGVTGSPVVTVTDPHYRGGYVCIDFRHTAVIGPLHTDPVLASVSMTIGEAKDLAAKLIKLTETAERDMTLLGL